MMQLLSFCTA